MNQLYALYLDGIQAVEWQLPENFQFPTPMSELWLMEQGSLSRRLEKHCGELSVSRMQQKLVEGQFLSENEAELLSRGSCLVREVILCGDEREWVLGRTLIPESSLKNQEVDFQNQGDIPLGITVFSADNVRRDQLQLGWIELDGRWLVARRSRLWMNDKPMLVAELFLPDSPIYQQDGNSVSAQGDPQC